MKTQFNRTLTSRYVLSLSWKRKNVSTFYHNLQYHNVGDSLRETQYWYNDVTWAPWHLESPVYQLIIQHLVQTRNHKREHRSSTPMSLWGNPLTTGVFPHQGLMMRKAFPWQDIPILFRYNDVIMSAMASQITSLTIVYSAVYSGADQR